MANRKRTPLEVRFWSRIDRSGECWLWTGALGAHGYGVISEGGRNGKNLLAHRLSYELSVGPIPDGLHIDHLCRVRGCVNPAHLEAVTQAENSRRALLKDECVHGHPYDQENTYITPAGHKKCRRCRREGMRRYKMEKRAA